MNLRQLIESFRIEAADKSPKPMWTDDLLLRLFAEAEEEAAIRKKLLFDDSTAGITPLAVVAGTNSYALDDRFFLVTSIKVWDATNTRSVGDVYLTTRDRLDQMRYRWREERWEPRYAVQEDKRLVLAGLIDRAYTLRVEGYRTPLVRLDDQDIEGGLDASPEIGRIHHRFLVHWVLARAYGIEDADTFDATRRDREMKAFEQYFGRRPDADLYKDAQADQPHANIGYY